MICVKCQSANDDKNKFCGECGAGLEASFERVAVADEPGAFYCAKHTKIVTRLSCGRCEKPICPKCTVHGAAGIRCRDCSRNRIPVRPAGVLHEAGRALGSVANSPSGGRVWYLALWMMIISFFRGSND